MDGQMIAFSPHTTSTSACQLNVDGFGLKGLRPSPGVDFIGGELIQGTPYTARYNNSDGVWYVHGFMSSPYAVPFLGGMDYWDTVTPNSAFILPAGQAISRTVYSRAFARWGTTFGAGDGSTTFNVPDKRGRVSATPDNMGGGDAARLADGHCLLAAGRFTFGYANGEGAHTLGAGEIPTITSAGSASVSGTGSFNGPVPYVASGSFTNGTFAGSSGIYGLPCAKGGSWGTQSSLSINSSGSASVSSNNTGGASHNNAQPTILCNYILRII